MGLEPGARVLDVACGTGNVKPGFDAVETSIVAVSWELQRSAAGSAEFFAKNAGPIQLALGRLDAPKQAALLQLSTPRERQP